MFVFLPFFLSLAFFKKTIGSMFNKFEIAVKHKIYRIKFTFLQKIQRFFSQYGAVFFLMRLHWYLNHQEFLWQKDYMDSKCMRWTYKILRHRNFCFRNFLFIFAPMDLICTDFLLFNVSERDHILEEKCLFHKVSKANKPINFRN